MSRAKKIYIIIAKFYNNHWFSLNALISLA